MIYVYYVERTAAPYNQDKILFVSDKEFSEYLDQEGNFYCADWDIYKKANIHSKLHIMMDWHFQNDLKAIFIEIIE